MARVLYGPYITELRGSIGGVTFQNNQSGNISKLKQRFRKNVSPTQRVRLNEFREVVALWNSLDSTTRGLWNTFAASNLLYNKYGGSKTVSGHQYFMSINRELNTFGLSMLSSPPSFASPPTVPTFTVTPSSSALTINFGSAFSFTSHALLAYCSPPLKSTSDINRTHLVNTNYRTTTPSTSYSISTGYQTTFLPGPWSDFYAGSSCFILICLQTLGLTTGLFSPFQSAIVPINK